ncbi:tRNA pseudouridine(38-40) synthase TruA [Lysinibacter cavernae]|uniref:tRNA pseudouridine synthase A n=1 Tax=Lysinibacter cavernae TaxID=1640652 RepID=A0A7X5R1Z4_9MICO|nr:tRNA pseudouridine(38-40) synthase TruA [Lysinibacter cavernae]NIH54178.1 tRNA pseudouridine38-40 synthase [Lysinibacter cavernae]
MPSSTTRRFVLPISYDGTEFAGWAKQPGLRTVQGVLETSLGTITRHPDNPPVLTVAGRTDAGVHARGQVAHVDLNDDHLAALGDRKYSGERVTPAQNLRSRLSGVFGINNVDLAVGEVTEVSKDFDARFSALWRRYEYRIADLAGRKDPIHRRHTVWLDVDLDLDLMQAAAQSLIGLHDFAAFCRRREGATTVRTLQHFAWTRDAEGVLIATVRADAFCHSMVRSLVGGCVAVGSGRLTLDELLDVLHQAKRGSRFIVMPAHGLSLEQVAYPDASEWSARAELTRARRALEDPNDLDD